METNSTENNEINLYDDLVKFNEMSPEERVAAIQNSVVETQPSGQQTATETAEPFKEAVSQSGEFNFVMSESIQTAGPVVSQESNDMIFMLSEPEAQAINNSAGNETIELLLNYQDQPSDVLSAATPLEATPFSDFAAEPQKVQPTVITQQHTPVAEIKESLTPIDDIFSEEIQHDFFTASQPVPQPLTTVQEKQPDFLAIDKTPAPPENVIEETKLPAARTTDKQGVRITVREATAGSVTLSVADILGEDDFDDQQSDSADQLNKQPEPLPAIEPQIAPVAAAQPETMSSELEPLKISDFLFTTLNDSDAVEEVARVAETPVTDPLNLPDQTSLNPEATFIHEDFRDITSALIETGHDADKLEELLKGSRPLKITGFLNDPYKSDDVAGEPEEIICPDCGHISKATDLLCLECGAFFEDNESEEQSKLACLDCGENVAADEVFCPACGSILLAH